MLRVIEKKTNVDKNLIPDHQAFSTRPKQESISIIKKQLKSKNKLLEVLENYTHQYDCARSNCTNMDFIDEFIQGKVVHLMSKCLLP